MRLFIAIGLDDAVKASLMEMQRAMRRGGVRGNYTPAENLHLTLAFIGEYADPERVLDVMDLVPFEAFPLTLSGLGCFGDLYWAGLGGSEALAAYAKRLRRTLAENGIPYDRKRFSPHITLLRRAEFEKGRGMPGIAVPRAEMTVRRVSLMRSNRAKSGMIYTELGYISAL